MEDYSMYVPNVHFEQIPIRNLVSNQEYQRILSQAHIARAAAHFDLYQINPVKVSQRDGINYVFNGQHTIEIVAAVSGSRDTPVWCMVYGDLSYAHEADIFANQMKYVKALRPIEIFKANLEAGNDDQLIIRDLVEAYRLKVSEVKGPCSICAIATVEAIYRKYGYHVLSRTLRLLVSAWEGEANSFSANFLNAVTKLVVVYGDALNDRIFKERVGSVSVKQIGRMAQERRRGHMGFAEAMLIAYNGKRKNTGRLHMNLLYARDSPLFEEEETETLQEAEASHDQTGVLESRQEVFETAGGLLALGDAGGIMEEPNDEGGKA